MKIVVERETCIGSGMCTTIAPSVFDIDERGTVILRQATHSEDHATVSEGDIEAVRDAVACCPVHALSLSD